jgi:hypothetical protein
MDEFSFLIPVIIILVIILLMASMWMIYTKAGQAGVSCIIPIYGSIVLARIIRKPWWWIFLWNIPYLGIIWSIWGLNLLVKSFGKSICFTLGCLFLPFIFLPILAFGDSQYLYLVEPYDEQKEADQYIQEIIDRTGGDGDAVIIDDKCPACGAYISDSDKECPDCGLALR